MAAEHKYNIQALNALLDRMDAQISSVNSSSTPLGIDGVFTGAKVDTLQLAQICVIATASHDSAIDGLSVQWSTDGTNWDKIDSFTIYAGVANALSFQPKAQYFRVVYTNGGVAQTYFRLQVTLRPVISRPASRRLADMVLAEDDVEIVASIISGVTPSGGYKQVKVTNGGSIKSSFEELNDAAIAVDNPLPARLTDGTNFYVGSPALQALADSTETTPTRIIKTIAATGTPEALAAAGTVFRYATLQGKKAARTNNVGDVWIDITSGDGTQSTKITPGQSITIQMPPGEKGDLNDWYCDVENAGDGVIIVIS